VTGFGRRPITDAATGTEGRCSKAARERSRGEWGTRFSGRYGDFVGADGAAGTHRGGSWCGDLCGYRRFCCWTGWSSLLCPRIEAR